MTEDEMYDIICSYEESERDYHERNIELENENTKLRELCKDMWRHMVRSVQYDEILYPARFSSRMNELEIKVDE